MATNLKEDIKPISYIKTNAADMMRYVNENKNSIIITQNGEAKAVLIDIEEYQDMQNAFHLLNIIQLSEKDVKSGNIKKSEDVFGSIKGKYNFNAKKV
jgi:prevent-host-death family protein